PLKIGQISIVSRRMDDHKYGICRICTWKRRYYFLFLKVVPEDAIRTETRIIQFTILRMHHKTIHTTCIYGNRVSRCLEAVRSRENMMCHFRITCMVFWNDQILITVYTPSDSRYSW